MNKRIAHVSEKDKLDGRTVLAFLLTTSAVLGCTNGPTVSASSTNFESMRTCRATMGGGKILRHQQSRRSWSCLSDKLWRSENARHIRGRLALCQLRIERQSRPFSMHVRMWPWLLDLQSYWSVACKNVQDEGIIKGKSLIFTGE